MHTAVLLPLYAMRWVFFFLTKCSETVRRVKLTRSLTYIWDYIRFPSFWCSLFLGFPIPRLIVVSPGLISCSELAFFAISIPNLTLLQYYGISPSSRISFIITSWLAQIYFLCFFFYQIFYILECWYIITSDTNPLCIISWAWDTWWAWDSSSGDAYR